MARAHHYLLEHRVFRRYLKDLAPKLDEEDAERAAFLAGFSASVAKVIDYVLADADALAAFEADQILVIDLLDPIRGRRQAERARAHPLFERLGAPVFGPLFERFDDAPAATLGADASAAQAAWTGILEAAVSEGGGAGVGVLLRWAPGARLALAETRPAFAPGVLDLALLDPAAAAPGALGGDAPRETLLQAASEGDADAAAAAENAAPAGADAAAPEPRFGAPDAGAGADDPVGVDPLVSGDAEPAAAGTGAAQSARAEDETADADAAASETAASETAASETAASETAAPEMASPDRVSGEAEQLPPPTRRAPRGPSLISALRAGSPRAEVSAAPPQRRFSRILPRAETPAPPRERPIPLAPKRPAPLAAETEAPLGAGSGAEPDAETSAAPPPLDDGGAAVEPTTPARSAERAAPLADALAPADEDARAATPLMLTEEATDADAAPGGEAAATAEAQEAGLSEAAPSEAASSGAALANADPSEAAQSQAVRSAAAPEEAAPEEAAPEEAAPREAAFQAEAAGSETAPSETTPLGAERARPQQEVVRPPAPADELELVFWNIGDGSPQLFVELAHKLLSERAPSMDAYFEMLTALALGETTRRAAIEALAETASDEAAAQEAEQREVEAEQKEVEAAEDHGPHGEGDRTAPRWRVFWL